MTNENTREDAGESGTPEEKENLFVRIMTSSWTLVAAILAGVSILKWAPELVPALRPLGEGYMNLLEMTVIPFAVCATISSLAGFIRSDVANHMIRRTALITLAMFLGVALYGIAIAFASQKFIEPSSEAYARIGEMMLTRAPEESVVDNWAIFEIDSKQPTKPHETIGIRETLLSSIPSNVFQALSEGDMIKVVVFFLLFALTTRHMPKHAFDVVKGLVDGVLFAATRILDWIYILAAPGIACIIINSFADYDVHAILPFLKFAVLLVAAILVAMIISLTIIKICSRRSFGETIRKMYRPAFIAGAANSELLAMPKAMTSLEELGYDKNAVNLIVPLGINLMPNGSAIVFAVSTVYCLRLYSYPIDVFTIFALIVTIPIAAIATVQSGPLVWYGFLAIPLGLFGMPVGPVLIVLYAADFIVDRMISMLEVLAAGALVGLIKPVDRPVRTKARTKARASAP